MTTYNPTYWCERGELQAIYEELWADLVPPQGRAKTRHGEALRSLARVYYRRYNDGDWYDEHANYDCADGLGRYDADVRGDGAILWDNNSYDFTEEWEYINTYSGTENLGFQLTSETSSKELDEILTKLIRHCLEVEKK